MPSTTASIACTTTPLEGVETDLLILPWFEGDPPTAVAGLDRATGGEIARALASAEFRGKPFELFITPVSDGSFKTRRVALCGAGPIDRYDTAVARKLATASGLAARERRVPRAAFALRPGRPAASGDVDLAGFAQAIAEGLTLAEFDGGRYKTVDAADAYLPGWLVVLPHVADTSPESMARVESFVSRGRVLGEYSNLARELSNEPGNALTPREFASRAAAAAKEAGVAVDVLDEKQIAELGMGLLLGVAQGSSEPPRLLVLRHEPFEAKTTPVLGLVGKGITFDTGGISIKPADGMERMKDDMAGGAAVIAAMCAIARLGAPIRVIGVVPMTENMPGGRAVKPGDVLKSAAGKTVEVVNTDAEGRLILGDGLWYARRLGATHLVDVATLTGAIVVALGKSTSGIFGSPESWVEHVRRVANRAGDRVWPLPLFDEYRDQLKSDIADMMNTGGRAAGSITAAMFLKEFAAGLPWAHIDIAGTAWVDDPKPYLPKGASGVAVRTLAELPFSVESWPN